MKHALELAQTGRGQIVAIVAEAASGKSRLGMSSRHNWTEGLATLDRTRVGHARVAVTDAGGEEFDEAAAGHVRHGRR